MMLTPGDQKALSNTMAYLYEKVRVICHDLVNKCPSNRYVLVLHKHLGDVFYAIGSKDAFAESYGERIFFVIRPQHEFLMKLWQVDAEDYLVFDIDLFVKKNQQLLDGHFKGKKFSKRELDEFENEFLQALFPCIPTKDSPFVCDNLINQFFSYERYWCYRWADNLGIEKRFKFEVPPGEIKLSSKVEKVVGKLGGFDKIVLIAPEAQTSTELPLEWWAIITTEIHKLGLVPLVNSKRIVLPYGISCFDFQLSLEDVVAIGFRCNSVIALRSGLCDVLVGVGDRLTSISPAILRREDKSLSVPFNQKTFVQEVQLYQWTSSPFIWKNINFGRLLQPYINHIHYAFWREFFLSILFPKSNHKFCKKFFNNIAGKSKVFPDNNIENPPSPTLRIANFIVYKSEKIYKENRYFILRTYFNGCVKIKKTDLDFKYYLFGIPFFARKQRRHLVYKVLGIPVFFHDRSKSFWKRFKETLFAEYEQYSDFIILRHNIGESVIYLSYFREWLKASGMSNPAIILWNEKHYPLYKMFLGETVPILRIPIAQSDINSFIREPEISFDGVKVHCPTFRIAEKMKEANYHDESVNFVDYIRESMGIKKGTLSLPNISDEATSVAHSCVLQYCGQQPFVILCPEATSLQKISSSFWDKLVRGFTQKGYDVLINKVYDGEIDLPNTQNTHIVNLQLDQLCAIVKMSAGFVSLASGLGVLLTFLDKRGDLIYSAFKSKSIGYTATLSKKIYSVENLPLPFDNHVDEWIMSEEQEDQILESILMKYENIK